jgi:MFS family permease
MWSGLAIGPLITVAATPIGGTCGAWAAIVVLGIASALLVSFTRAQRGDGAKGALLPTSWGDVMPRGAGLPGLAFGLAAYGYGTISALLVLYLRHSGLGGASVGLSVFAAAFLITRAVGSSAVDHHGRGPIAVIMLLVETTGLGLMAAVHTLAAAMIGTTLIGAGVSLMFPATVALTLSRTGNMRTGTAVGATTSFWDVGILAAGPIGGLVTQLGYQYAFAAAALLAAGAIAIVADMRTNLPERAGPTTPPTPCKRPPRRAHRVNLQARDT